ncbi:unnamed protein product [Mytilus edulis]|uniref:Uncharacterized protein n=1 Tax=Mytilus edulis TaxID=6550 RepID=A0A8S3QN45_MYTED|nr:unnamed protein product [Mytilus edulis]
MEKTSLKYIEIQNNPLNEAHNIWKSVKNNSKDVKAGEIKARISTQTYIFQAKRAKFDPKRYLTNWSKKSGKKTNDDNAGRSQQSIIDKFMRIPNNQKGLGSRTHSHTPPTPPEALHDRTRADYGAACSGSVDCTEKTNIVCDTTCKCTATSFRKSTPECAPKIVLKTACTASQPDDQCADANAECTAGKTCVCKSGFYADKDSKCSAKILLKAACTASQPDDQCTDALAACASGNTCLCKSGNFENKDGKCSKQILLKAACTASQPDDQCADALAACASGNTCLCKAGNFENKDGKCAKQILLKAACTASQPDDQCADALAACASGNTCLCKARNFENKDGKCAKQVAFNANCGVAETASDQCVATTECKNDSKGTKKCLCKATHYDSGGTCTPRIVPGVTCAADQCVTHASCNTSSKCQCETGYTATPTVKPTMCSGVIEVATLSYMLVIPIFVSMMFVLR